MIDQTDAILDDILCRWHLWGSSRTTTAGYPTENPTCRLYRSSRQYDDSNGSLDEHVEDLLMAGVDRCVGRMADPWRMAVHLNARNIATGVVVWCSPRLPADREERAVVVMEARVKVLRELQSDGLI